VSVDETSGTNGGRRKLVIGLTGGIGSGKSVAAGVLRELGAEVVDSDAMTHDELSKPEVVETFRSWWGAGVCKPDGTLDKAAVGDIIFNDAADRRRLEAYLYPRLEDRRHAMMRAFNADPSVRAIVINSPLLYEVGLDEACDVVVFVECDRHGDAGISAVVAARTAAQKLLRGRHRAEITVTLDKKREAADYTVINNTDVDALRSQLKPLVEGLLSTHASC